MSKKFNVGDKVIAIHPEDWCYGMAGVVVGISPETSTFDFSVEFPGYKGTRGHSAFLNDGARNRWYLSAEELEPAVQTNNNPLADSREVLSTSYKLSLSNALIEVVRVCEVRTDERYIGSFNDRAAAEKVLKALNGA